MTKQTFTFLLVPGLSMMSLVSAIEPLRSLNRLVRRTAYTWRFVSLDGAPVEASNEIALPAEPLEAALADTDYLFVCGGPRMKMANEKRFLAPLRQAARRGIVLGALSTGTYLLARAGLLKGYRCTIHWENRLAFREDFPDIDCSIQLYEIDRDRITVSGGTAAMDLMLYLIADRYGPDLARDVANQFNYERIRDGREDQRGGRLDNLSRLPEKVRQAIAIMQRRVEDPVPLPEVSRRVGLSPRQLERLFMRSADMTPLRCYMQIRVERAHELLLYSDRSVIDIAVYAGFTSSSHFSMWYKRIYGRSPSDSRGRDQKRAVKAGTASELSA